MNTQNIDISELEDVNIDEGTNTFTDYVIKLKCGCYITTSFEIPVVFKENIYADEDGYKGDTIIGEIDYTSIVLDKGECTKKLCRSSINQSLREFEELKINTL